MNVKVISFATAAALFASSALAGQPSGRDTLYAERDTTPTSGPPTVSINGRASVFSTGLPTPSPKSVVEVAGNIQPGRT